MSVLNEFEEYRQFRQRSRSDDEDATVSNDQGVNTSATLSDQTPEEVVEAAFEQIEASLGAELLEHLMEGTPEFFEQVVVDLLLAMGYGGSRRDAGERLGQTGDMGSTGSSARTSSAWTRSTYRPSAGTLNALSVDRKYRDSSELCTVRAPRRACSSPHPASAARRANTLTESRRGSYSLAATGWLN